MKPKTKQQHPKYLALMLLIIAGIGVGVWFKFSSNKPSGDLVFASGQQGGVYVELAREFKRVIEDEWNDVNLKLKSSAGSVENVNLIDSKKADLALVQNDIPGSANLRTVAPLHQDYLHFIVRKEAGIKSIRDLDGRNFATGLAGSGSLPIVRALADYFSLSKETVIECRSVSDGINAIQTGQTDALLLMLGFRAPAILELFKNSSQLELVELPLVEVQALEGFTLSYPICEKSTIPPFTYGNQPTQPVDTLTIQTLLVAHKEVPPELIRPITEVLFAHRSELIHQHPAAAQMTEEFSPSLVSFPLHEGARQYFSRDEPGFIIRYAETMAFILSLCLASYGLITATRKWLAQRQKDRLDEYYIQVENYINTLESNPELTPTEIAAIDNELKEIRHEIFENLALERLSPDSSFLILQRLLEQCSQQVKQRYQS